MTENNAYLSLLREYHRACDLHPKWPGDLIHQVAIVAEESGEAVQAALNHVYHGDNLEKVKTELIQTGAMCIRALINLPEA